MTKDAGDDNRSCGGLVSGLLPELIGYELRRAQIRVFQDFADSLAEVDLTPGHFGVLVLLCRNPGISQTALAKAVGVERSTLGEVIEKLEARNLVKRKPAPEDRRSHAVRLSPQGERLLDQATPLVRDHEDRIAQNLSGKERKLLLDLLNRIAPET